MQITDGRYISSTSFSNYREQYRYSYFIKMFKSTSIIGFLMVSFLCLPVMATPPACFLSCVGEIARDCEKDYEDFACICSRSEQLIGCVVDICPYGNFEAARDHYFGTCLEHKKSTHVAPIIGEPPADKDQECDSDEEQEPPKKECEEDESPKVDDDCNSDDETSKPEDEEPKEDCSDSDDAPSENTPDNEKGDVETPKTDDDYEDEPCEWEETETTDSTGNVIIIRKPLNVSDKFKKPNNKEKPKKIIIKRPKIISSDAADGDLATKLKVIGKQKKSKSDTRVNRHDAVPSDFKSNEFSLGYPISRQKVSDNNRNRSQMPY